MTLVRLALTTPRDWDQVQIFNQGMSKYVAEYRFAVDWDVLKQAMCYGIDLDPYTTIAEVLKLVGSHSTLWIGPHKGIVAPMDQQPEGWTYASRREYEPENFWQWVPDLESERRLVSDANRVTEDPLGVLLGENDSVFKSTIPFQFHRRYGEILSIEGIPVQKLAGIVQSGIDWVFEFERKA